MMTAAPVCQVRPTLRIGARSSDVRSLQERLNLHFGYRQQLLVDGIFGPQTDRAVRVIQYRYFLAQDGIVGPQTWAALCGSRPQYPILARKSTGTLVKAVQQTLKDTNFYTGSIDGIFGELTERAVKALQTAYGFPVSGRVTQETWSALIELAIIQTAIF